MLPPPTYPPTPCKTLQNNWGWSVVCFSSLVTLSCVNVPVTWLKANLPERTEKAKKSLTIAQWRISDQASLQLFSIHQLVRAKHSGRGRTRGNLGSRCHFHKPQSCAFITAVFLTLPAWDEQLPHSPSAWDEFCHVPFQLTEFRGPDFVWHMSFSTQNVAIISALTAHRKLSITVLPKAKCVPVAVPTETLTGKFLKTCGVLLSFAKFSM